jgi:hypothetical protein
MREQITSGQLDDLDVHYICCQLIATYVVTHEESVAFGMRMVEGIKDEIEEMEVE